MAVANMKIVACCDPMVRAHSPGTDNESYGALARVCEARYDGDDKLHIGDYDSLPPITFCPWCGSRVVYR